MCVCESCVSRNYHIFCDKLTDINCNFVLEIEGNLKKLFIFKGKKNPFKFFCNLPDNSVEECTLTYLHLREESHFLSEIFYNYILHFLIRIFSIITFHHKNVRRKFYIEVSYFKHEKRNTFSIPIICAFVLKIFVTSLIQQISFK